MTDQEREIGKDDLVPASVREKIRAYQKGWQGHQIPGALFVQILREMYVLGTTHSTQEREQEAREIVSDLVHLQDTEEQVAAAETEESHRTQAELRDYGDRYTAIVERARAWLEGGSDVQP